MSGRCGHPGQQLVEWELEQEILKVNLNMRLKLSLSETELEKTGEDFYFYFKSFIKHCMSVSRY